MRHGRPIAFYSDKHAIFRINKPDAEGGSGMTQFGRALHEINIDILCANSAPAKGRPPFDSTDGHRSPAEPCDLDDVFAWKEEQTVSNALTLQYDKVLFLVQPNDIRSPCDPARRPRKEMESKRSSKAPRRRGQDERHISKAV